MLNRAGDGADIIRSGCILWLEWQCGPGWSTFRAVFVFELIIKWYWHSGNKLDHLNADSGRK